MAEGDEVRAQGMNYFNVPMSGFGRPKMETVLTVLDHREVSFACLRSLPAAAIGRELSSLLSHEA
jgi:hypothetical protein